MPPCGKEPATYRRKCRFGLGCYKHEIRSVKRVIKKEYYHVVKEHEMSETRVKYYGEHNMATGWQLKKAGSILDDWDGSPNVTEINRVIEFYNIKKLFDCNIRLKQWDECTYAVYKAKCQKISGLLGRFCSTISDINFETLYASVEHSYIDDFWQLVCYCKVHPRISAECFNIILTNHPNALRCVLQQKSLTLKFGQSIAEHLLRNSHTAEWLIACFLEDCKNASKQYYFPVEFTQKMRNDVLIDYVDSNNPNPNYLQLLEQAQNSSKFPVSDRLKLKARKKRELLRGENTSNNVGVSYGMEISFKSIPDGSVECHESEKEHIYCFSYSREWIQDNQDYPTLLNNFIYLFNYVDHFFRCTFPAREAELAIVERYLGMRGKNEYKTGMVFKWKSMRSSLQMQVYQNELERIGVRVEDLFKWFFEVYLKEEFDALGFTYNPPSAGATYAEKCKLLASSIDGALKQYRLFREEGYVDRELLEMSSEHVFFNQLPSLRNKKYAYSNSAEFRGEQNLLFSNQSAMAYTEKTKDKYETLAQLLLNENMTMDDFVHYQKSNMQWLINRGAVLSNTDGCLVVDISRAFILKDLFENEVTCPSYLDESLQTLVDALVSSGDMKYENTLFSKPEQDYLNYILNKSECSNGLDLRNKYIHDSHPLDEGAQKKDYLEFLKVMTLIVIKINEEFCMRD